MKYVVEAMPPVGAQLVRYLVAATAMMAFLWRREGSIRLPRRDLAASRRRWAAPP